MRLQSFLVGGLQAVVQVLGFSAEVTVEAPVASRENTDHPPARFVLRWLAEPQRSARTQGSRAGAGTHSALPAPGAGLSKPAPQLPFENTPSIPVTSSVHPVCKASSAQSSGKRQHEQSLSVNRKGGSPELLMVTIIPRKKTEGQRARDEPRPSRTATWPW